MKSTRIKFTEIIRESERIGRGRTRVGGKESKTCREKERERE